VRFDRKTTMRGLAGRYVEEVLKPCLDVPLGGVQDESAQMSPIVARNPIIIDSRNWVTSRPADPKPGSQSTVVRHDLRRQHRFAAENHRGRFEGGFGLPQRYFFCFYALDQSAKL